MSDAHYLVQQAKTKQELEDEVRFDTFIDKVCHNIAAYGNAYHDVTHGKRIPPLKVRNTIRRLRSLGFTVTFTIRKASNFDDIMLCVGTYYTTNINITLP